jgi:hypothetical protein
LGPGGEASCCIPKICVGNRIHKLSIAAESEFLQNGHDMKSAPARKKSDPSVIERPGTAIPNTRPPSATNTWIVMAGFAALVASMCLVRFLKMQDAVNAALICMGAVAVVNFLPDILLLKVHRRASTGIDWSRHSPSWGRVWTKFLGLLLSFAFAGSLYFLFPEYQGAFYDDFRKLLHKILPWWIGLALPYFYFIDARQADPHDGYYQAGLVAQFNFKKVNRKLLLQHTLGWLVKIFFMALMFTYFVSDLKKFIAYDFSIIHNFRTFYEFGYYFVFLADVSLACVGYLVALRLFDTHLRWPEPTVTGWLVALMCYQPFWTLFGRSYFDYSRDFAWGPWLEGKPTVYCVWGSTILGLYIIYLLATVVFGCRFSNLTHRGILTNGPYRLTKHPAYIAKNLAYWLTFIPFIVSESAADSIRRSIALLMVNGIYYIRARTEEAHLSQDPVYVQYKNWIARHGIFRWLSRKSN